MGWRSRISRITARRIFVVVTALILIFLVRLLFITPLKIACRALNIWFKERVYNKPADMALNVDIAWAVSLASRKARGSRCLDRALVAKALLCIFRRDSLLQVGMAADPDGRLRGHAWIETAAGIVVGGNQAELQKYKPLPQAMTLEQQIIFFLAMQRNSGANARNRASYQALNVQ